jgi:hypothetical protein
VLVELKQKKRLRGFFNIVHQYTITNTKTDAEKGSVDAALKEMANYKYRTCTGVTDPENVGNKTIIKFTNCDYGNKKYIRIMRRLPIDTFSH